MQLFYSYADYPVDLSDLIDEPGTVCAKSCDGFCPATYICKNQAEAEPKCLPGCEGKYWVWNCRLIPSLTNYSLEAFSTIVAGVIECFQADDKYQKLSTYRKQKKACNH